MKTELLFTVMILFCCCGRKSINEPNNADAVIKIDLLSEPESTVKKLSDFAENIEYIPIQTTENSLIGDLVLKIVNIDNRIYIMNSGLEGEILCFDMDGRFLFKINNRGRGPEEYIDVADFDVSSNNMLITILSALNHKLLVYGISDTGFYFQRSIALKDPVPYRISLVPESDKAFLAIPPWRGAEPILSLLINTSGDTIQFKPNCYKYDMVRKENFWASNEMLAYSIENAVCFKEEFSDTVFYVDAEDNSFKPRIIFDSHGTLGTPEMRGGSETWGDNNLFIANIFETSRYVFYYYGTTKTQNRILFDKTTKKKYRLDISIVQETIANIPREVSKIVIKDDLRGGPDFNIEFQYPYCSGGKLFSFLEAIALKKYVGSEDFKNAKVSDAKKDELKKIAYSLKETDNPVLIIVTPKD